LIVKLIEHTKLSNSVIAGRTCWDSFHKGGNYETPTDDITETDKEFLNRTINKNKHGSIAEHMVYTFAVDGISRACLMELSRHRIMSLSVRSSRYTLKSLKDEASFYNSNQAEGVTWRWDLIEKYCVLTGIDIIDESIAQALHNLKELIEEGCDNDKAKFALVEAFKTSLKLTINMRSLQNFISLRSDKSALWEIRDLAKAIYEAVPEKHKFLLKEYYKGDNDALCYPCNKGKWKIDSEDCKYNIFTEADKEFLRGHITLNEKIKRNQVAKEKEEVKGSSKLDAILSQINKEFGTGTIMELRKDQQVDVDTWYSTGSLGLDLAIGKGLPSGRIVELYGMEAVGKSTICAHLVADAQSKGKKCAYIDTEHAVDFNYFSSLGVALDKLIFSQPNSGDDALNIVEALTDSGEVDVIIIDSVATLTPRAELEGSMSDQQVGLLARMMSKALRKLVAKSHNNGTTIVFINQLRENINTMGYGDKKTTTGGNALKFYASVRIELKRIQTVKQGDVAIANKIKAIVKKNKVGIPFREAEYEIKFGQGISQVGEIIKYALDFDVLDKTGTWISYEDKGKWQGTLKMEAELLENDKLLKEIKDKVLEKLDVKE